MTDNVTSCDCDDEYPCEQHFDAVVIREGASLHTADESLALFVDDAVSLGAELSPWGKGVMTVAWRLLREHESLGVAWLPDNDSGEVTRDELVNLSDQMETELHTLGYRVFRNDGYVIGKITGGPLATDDDVCDDCRND